MSEFERVYQNPHTPQAGVRPPSVPSSQGAPPSNNPYNQNPPGSVESIGLNPSFPPSSTPDLEIIPTLQHPMPDTPSFMDDGNHTSPMAHLNQAPHSVEGAGGGQSTLQHNNPGTPQQPQANTPSSAAPQTSCPSTPGAASSTAPNTNSTTTQQQNTHSSSSSLPGLDFDPQAIIDGDGRGHEGLEVCISPVISM